MAHNIEIALLVLGLVLLPFSLLIWWIYRGIQAADEPPPAVVSFQARFWGFDSVYFSFFACLTFWIPFLFIWKSIGDLDFGILIFLPLAVLPGVGPFVYLRLHWTYWQHDKHHFVIFYRQENSFVYGTSDTSTKYKTSDVVQLTRHATIRSSFSFAYTTVSFCDGSTLVFTSLLCDDLAQFLPNAKNETTQSWYPQLPNK
jgi:hypothetical protein